MKIVFLLGISLCFNSCAIRQVIDESYTSKTDGYKKIYAAKVDHCVDSVKKSLKDMGAGIEEIKGDRIISERWAFLNYAEGTGSAYYASAINYTVSAKMYVDVTSSGKNNCQIYVAKVRAWENNKDLEKLSNSDTQSYLVVPFFKNVDERISN